MTAATATVRRPRAAVVVPVRQRTPEWLEARTHGVTGSDAAAAVGFSHWKSPVQLWAEKLGLVPPQPETLAMQIGTALEPLIARLYTEATGIPVRRANLLRQHPDHPWMLVSLDRTAGRDELVELKYSARATGYGEPGTDEVPDDVLAQGIHQMAVMDRSRVTVALLTPTRPTISLYPIHRDLVAEAAVIEREREFWRHVQDRTEPDIDGSAETAAVLRAIYPTDDGTLLPATPELAALVDALAGARAAKKAAEAAEGLAANQLLAAIGEASGIAGLLAARKNRDGEKVDWQAVAGDYRRMLELAIALEEAGDRYDVAGVRSVLAEVVPHHTEPKPGARPLRLLNAKGDE